jgi:hypothetical protein
LLVVHGWWIPLHVWRSLLWRTLLLVIKYSNLLLRRSHPSLSLSIHLVRIIIPAHANLLFLNQPWLILRSKKHRLIALLGVMSSLRAVFIGVPALFRP